MTAASLRHLLRARDLIDGRYGEPLDVPRLAREALASPSHFARGFRRAFGETPHRYLLRRRMERAAALLRETDESVTAISLRVGFRSLGSFEVAFRRFVGESPTAHRERARPRAEELARLPVCFAKLWTRPDERAAFEQRTPGDGSTVVSTATGRKT